MAYRSFIRQFSRLSLIVALIVVVLPLVAAPTDLDLTWGGGDGITEADFNPNPINGNHIAALLSYPDGRVTVVGQNNTTSASTFAAVRFLANGAPDPSFGTNGISVLPLKPGSIDNHANGAALQTDGKIVIAGRLDYEDPVDGYDIRFGVLRLNQDGSLDPTFGDNGYFETSESPYALPIAIQSDGKIVVGGPFNLDPPEDPYAEVYDALLIRLNTDGSLDSTFGDGGKSVWVEEDDQHPMNIVVQPDGKIVMQMYISIYSGEFSNGVVRFNADGTVDTTFGDSGEVHFTNLDDSENNFGFMSNNMTITLQADGKLVIGGYQRNHTTNPEQYRPVLARLNTDGSPDQSFGNDGVVITDFTPARVLISHISIQPDGKILVGGEYMHTDKAYRTILRYSSNGELDTTWNGTGYLVANALGTIPFETPFVFAPIALQSDGKILTLYANYNYPAPDTGKFNVARFVGEGSVNTAPSLAAIGSQSAEDGQTLQFTATATDLENDNLTFSLDDGSTGSVPTGAEITTGGEFSWTPSEAQLGEHSFDVVVTDDGEPNLSDFETITVTVTEPPFVNTAPTLTEIGSKTVEEGQTLDFTASATDPDTTLGQTLTFTLDDGDAGSVPTGAAITLDGEFSWTPSEAQIGEHSFDVVVTDDGEPNLSDFETISVTVTAAPVEPPTELLTNRGFENKSPNNPKRAAKWTVSNLVSADGRVCNKTTPPTIYAYAGKCAFRFSLNTAKARYIEQKVTLSEALEGQTMRVAGYIKRNGLTVGAAVQVQITYVDNSKATLKIAIPGGTKGYKLLENTLVLEQDAEKARVRITTGKSKGRLLVDSLSLTVGDTTAESSPVTLPAAPDLRGH